MHYDFQLNVLENKIEKPLKSSSRCIRLRVKLQSAAYLRLDALNLFI
jgi:hypothetical protein